MEKLPLPYLAGCLDAGMFLTVRKQTARTPGTLRLRVVHQRPDVVKRARAEHGGSISYYEPEVGSPRFTWDVSGDQAAALLLAIQPYLVLSDDRVAAALQWRHLARNALGVEVSPEVRSTMDQLRDRMRS